MKFGIISDLHLGACRYRKIKRDQNVYCQLNYDSFEEAIALLKNQNIDALLVAGDLFDSPNPDVPSILKANQLLTEIGVPVYLIGGNHDYSQRNFANGYHAFDLLYGKNIIKSIFEHTMIEFDDCTLTMIPHKQNTPDTFKEIYKGKLSDKNKVSILMFHGIVDLDGSSSSDNSIGKAVISNYHLTIAGDVHLPNLIETPSSSILIPGSLMPSQVFVTGAKPAAYIYNTDKKKVESIKLKTPPVVHNIFSTNLNKTFQEISDNLRENDLYFIKYKDSIKNIDEALYKRALMNSLNLSLQSDNETTIESVKKVTDFWSFVKDEYPQYFEEFKLVVTNQ